MIDGVKSCEVKDDRDTGFREDLAQGSPFKLCGYPEEEHSGRVRSICSFPGWSRNTTEGREIVCCQEKGEELFIRTQENGILEARQ